MLAYAAFSIEGRDRRMNREKAIWIGVAVFAGFVVLAFATWIRGDIDELPESVEPAEPPYLTFFLIDGMRQDIFAEELEAGRLPELARLMQDGAHVVDGMSAFPTMTGFVNYPHLTGRTAPSSGVLGLRWFDRERDVGNFRNYVGKTHVRMNEDVNGSAKTFFQEYDAEYTSSFNSYMCPGVDAKITRTWDYTFAKSQDYWWLPAFLRSLPLVGRKLVPEWGTAEDNVFKLVLQDLRDNQPKFQWITLATPDAYNHMYGTDDGYVELLHLVDGMIGRYREASAEIGTEEHRYYAVATDHGVVDVQHNLDLRAALGEQGLSAWRGPATNLDDDKLAEPLSTWAQTDAIVAVNGNLLNFVYFRNPDFDAEEGWKHPLTTQQIRNYPRRHGEGTVDAVRVLLDIEGVELVILRAEGGQIEIFGEGGKGIITVLDDDRYAYRTVGPDPLRYDRNMRTVPLLDGEPRTSREWLHATHFADYPDAVVQVARVATAPGAPELTVTCEKGYDLAADYELFIRDYKGGHGGLRGDQLRVPFVLAGPEIRPGARLDTARSEDVGATLRAVMGLYVDDTFEGRVLREILH